MKANKQKSHTTKAMSAIENKKIECLFNQSLKLCCAACMKVQETAVTPV